MTKEVNLFLFKITNLKSLQADLLSMIGFLEQSTVDAAFAFLTGVGCVLFVCLMM